MVQLLNNRVKFKPNKQKAFIDSACKKLNCNSLKGLANSLDMSYFTLRKYHQERLLMPSILVHKLCKISDIKQDSLGIIETLSPNWGAIKGGKIGMSVLIKKYKNKIYSWRMKGNRNSNKLRTKKILVPKLDERLAEFIGAYLGDGTITPYFIRISGDWRYDMPYFNYLSNLVFKLFGINTSITKDKRLRNTAYLVIYSKSICSLLNSNYGILYGDKIRNKTCIPNQILSSKKFSIACLRGLIDTDGSISRRGRGGSQFCIQFTSYNPKLLGQVENIGKEIGIFTYKDINGTGTNSWKNILRYFEVVGSSNLKHIIRFHLRHSENKSIYIKEVPIYLEKDLYRNMRLPFRLGPWSSG